MTARDFFATTAKGMEGLLAAELRDLGATEIGERRAGVAWRGPLEVAYRAALWSRVANRILLPLGEFAAATPEALYAGARAIRWADHIGRGRTLAVDASLSRSHITHSHYAALKTKDAIVDRLRDERGVRPNIDARRPDVRVNLYLHADHAVVSIALSGESQHRRGYRTAGAAAPLKENPAAALLLLAEWPRRARAGEPLIDPMCGSGTIALEAALIAGDVAPGLRRTYFGCSGWRGHDAALWARLRREADVRAAQGLRRLPPIHAYDADARAVRAAQANLAGADLSRRVHLERRALAECAPIAGRGGATGGIVVTNPRTAHGSATWSDWAGCTSSSATCCAAASRAGPATCSPARRRSPNASACVRRGASRSTTVPSSAVCSSSRSPPRPCATTRARAGGATPSGARPAPLPNAAAGHRRP
jgi:23S rRNA (guanine2445-N2)-methyltransferase / 23S rRNA (guanine2069-N7)-methyltransferase